MTFQSVRFRRKSGLHMSGLSRVACINKDDKLNIIQYRHLTIDNMSKDKPSTSMTYVAFKNLRSVVRCMHPCLQAKNYVAIARAVVYCARSAHAIIAGIKCRYCTYILQSVGNLKLQIIFNGLPLLMDVLFVL